MVQQVYTGNYVAERRHRATSLPDEISAVFSQRNPDQRKLTAFLMVEPDARYILYADREVSQPQAFMESAGVKVEGIIPIPRDWARRIGAKKEVIVAGCGNYFEVWDPESYRKALDNNQDF